MAGSTPRILALITARGGSKGVPGKNLRPLAGKPLIAWSIAAGLAARGVERVVVSTDDEQIAAVSREHGAEVPFLRPAELAQDDSPHEGVGLHALDWLAENQDYRPDYLLLLQPTSPLRETVDIEVSIELAIKAGAPAVVSVRPADTHPLLARRLDEQGRLMDYLPRPEGYLRRQDLPPAYALNGAIYLVATGFFREQKSFNPPGALAYIMPPERSLDVDSEWDLKLCDLILRKAHGGQAV